MDDMNINVAAVGLGGRAKRKQKQTSSNLFKETNPAEDLSPVFLNPHKEGEKTKQKIQRKREGGRNTELESCG